MSNANTAETLALNALFASLIKAYAQRAEEAEGSEQEMLRDDVSGMEGVHAAIAEGDFAQAYAEAGELNTDAREQIPGALYEAIGGKRI